MRRFQIFLFLLVSTFLAGHLPAQKMLWQTAIGSSGYDNGMRLIPTDHNCFLMGGQTSSNTGFGEGNHGTGTYDLVVAKVSAEGQVIWRTLIGGSEKETFADMKATPDGGAILIGTTESRNWDAVETNGKMDFIVAKVDRQGNKEWVKCYGGVGNDKGMAVIALENGNYMIGGESGSRTGTMTYSRGGLDAWVAMLDHQGNVIKEKSLGGSGNEKVTLLFEIKKDRYLALCTTASTDGDVKDPLGAKDVWAVCLSKNFDIIWQRTFGGSDFDEAHAIIRAQNGELVISGTTFSEDQDLSLARYHGLGDSWMFQITDDGKLRWSQTYGGVKSDGGNGLAQAPDGGYILVGTTNSKDGGIVNKGLYDGFMVRTDSLGKVIWQGTFGGEDFEYLYDVMALEDGNYLALGFAESVKGDLASVNKEIGNDFWFFRFTDPDDPVNNVLKSVPYLAGSIKSQTTGLPIMGEISITDNTTMQRVEKVKNDNKTGLYEMDLPENGKYSVMYSSPGYMFYGQDLDFGLLAAGPEIRIDVMLQPILVGSKVILKNITFDIGKAEVRDESEPELRRLEAFLKANPNVKVEISGHTDNTGLPELVKSLSERRATRVRDWLLKNGVPGRQMQVAGYGMERPIDTNDTEEGRQKNRRVECEVVELL